MGYDPFQRPQKLRRPHKLPALIVSAMISFIVCCFYHSPSVPIAPVPPSIHSSRGCPQSPLLDDVLVVLRTGATEALEKLPIHFETVLRCVPHYIIYSDMDEHIETHHLHDVLDQVNGTLKATVPEFKLYNHLRAKGREGLEYQTVFGSGPGGAVDNIGWKLDKWKFLPMVDRALQHRPDAKWFVFVESDTYLIWQNMLEYLSRFDASQPRYIGKPMYIGDVLFGHGGSGFALSNPAMERVTTYWREHLEEFDQYTEREWAGDMILGRALKDVGVDLLWASPHLQGDSLTTMDWNASQVDKQPWCYAPLTFHHMTRAEFGTLWRFEQTWRHRNHANGATLRFRDVFKSLVRHQLQAERGYWDNISTETEYSDDARAGLSDEGVAALSRVEREAQFSFEQCHAACKGQPTCIQFSYVPGKCFISNDLRLGHAADSQCLEYSAVAGKCISTGTGKGEEDANSESGSFVRSGWMMNRVSDYVKELDQSCDSLEGNDWVT